MQVTVAADTPAPAFNLTALQTAFAHHADGSGVFESGQHPIIVGQAAYNSAYGKSFATSSFCNAPGSTKTACDGFARISDQGGMTFKFNTLLTGKTSTLGLPIQPKAMHDEMNSANFDEFGRMTANLGVEAVPATPVNQNITLYPYVNPVTELIDATGLPVGDLNVTPDLDEHRRDADLEDHAQRRGHAPDSLPPLRRAGAQPGHLGQHHHPAGCDRAGLEGHGADQSARGHDRRPQAGPPEASVGGPEQRPHAEPDDAAGSHRRRSTTSIRRGTRPIRSPTSW